MTALTVPDNTTASVPSPYLPPYRGLLPACTPHSKHWLAVLVGPGPRLVTLHTISPDEPARTSGGSACTDHYWADEPTPVSHTAVPPFSSRHPASEEPAGHVLSYSSGSESVNAYAKFDGAFTYLALHAVLAVPTTMASPLPCCRAMTPRSAAGPSGSCQRTEHESSHGLVHSGQRLRGMISACRSSHQGQAAITDERNLAKNSAYAGSDGFGDSA